MKIYIYLIFTLSLFLQGCSSKETQPKPSVTPDQASGISSGTSDPNGQSNSGTNKASDEINSSEKPPTTLGLEDYETYRQSVIQNIVEKTGEAKDSSGEFVSGSIQTNRSAVGATLQSIFDEHADFLQTLFTRQTDSEFLPYIQKYENLKKGSLRSDIKIFFSDRLQEAIKEDTEKELREWNEQQEYTPTEWEQQENLRQRQHEQQVIGFDYNFKRIEGYGACILGYLVFMDRDVWQILSEEEKELTLFHEIGHCDLYRDHIADEPSIMSVGLIEWFFLIMRNPNLNLQRNNNYEGGSENPNPMCLCNESGECSNKYCVDDNREESLYQNLIDIAKSRNFEPLYQELFSQNPQYATGFQVKTWTVHSRVIKEIAKEPQFQ